MEGTTAVSFTGNTITQTVAFRSDYADNATLSGNTLTNSYPFQMEDPDIGLTGVSGNTYTASSQWIRIWGTVNGATSLGSVDGVDDYYLNNRLIVSSGATLTISPGVDISGVNYWDLTVYGQLDATDATFSGGVDLRAESGGQLNLSNCTFAAYTLRYYDGSGGKVVSCNVNNIKVHDGADVDLACNNFSTGHVYIEGSPTAIVVIENNWWGTTDLGQIEAKITHHVDDPGRPWADYKPFLAGPPLGPDEYVPGNAIVYASQSYDTSVDIFTLAARVRDTLYGSATQATFLWFLEDWNEAEVATGNLSYNSGTGQWEALETFIGGLAPGNYTVYYSIFTGQDRLGSAKGNFTVPGFTATVKGTIKDVATDSPIEDANVCLYDAYAIWQVALQFFGGTIPSPEELAVHLSPIREATTGPDGLYEWNDIPLGNAYLVYASKSGYLEKCTSPFPIQATGTIITKDLYLPDSVNTLAGIVDHVESVSTACEQILNNNAKLAGEATEQWYEDDIYTVEIDWFSILGDVVGTTAGGISSLPEGIMHVSKDEIKNIARKIIEKLTEHLALDAINSFRAWLHENAFPEDQFEYMSSALHQPYLDRLTQTTQEFVDNAGTYQLADGFSKERSEELAQQITRQITKVIEGSDPYVGSPDPTGNIYGFTMADMMASYLELSELNQQQIGLEEILSGVQIVGGIITIGGAATSPTGAGAVVAGVAAVATEAAGFTKTLVASANILTKSQMAITFATGICGTYPTNNEWAVNILEDYLGLLLTEAITPFYLYENNHFNVSTDINMNFFRGAPAIWAPGVSSGFDMAQGVATVTITDQSSVENGNNNVTVRCISYDAWSPVTIGSVSSSFNKSLQVSSEICGPTIVELGGETIYSIPYRGFSRNLLSSLKPYYLHIDTYIGPWRVDSNYEYYSILAPGEVYPPITLSINGEKTSSMQSEVYAAATNAEGLVPLTQLEQIITDVNKLADISLSAAMPTLTTQFTAEPNLYAVDLRLFAPKESDVSILITNEQGKRLGYSSVDGITYSELLGGITNMAQKPISLHLLEPTESETYTIEIALLSPGLYDVPVTLFYEPVKFSTSIMTTFLSSIIIDGRRGTTQAALLRLAEASGQEALTDVNGLLSPPEMWGNNNITLPILSDANQIIGDIPAGEQRYVSWDVNYPLGAKLGKYVGTATISSNEATDLVIPVIALVRHKTETIGLYEGPDPNVATIQKSLTLNSNGTAQTWVYVPKGYWVVHAAMGIVGASANLQNPSIDIGGDETVEWAYSGKFDLGVLVSNVEDAFNDYLAGHTSEPNGVNIPVVVTGEPNETILFNGIQLYLDIIPGDFEPDWDVDLSDLGAFSLQWLSTDCNDPDWCGHSDLDYNGQVDFFDFSHLGDHWLETWP